MSPEPDGKPDCIVAKGIGKIEAARTKPPGVAPEMSEKPTQTSALFDALRRKPPPAQGAAKWASQFAPRAFAALVFALQTACASPPASIGALLARSPEGTLVIAEAPTALAADRAGLQAGDVVLMIDGAYVPSLSANEIRDRLRGEPGTFVDLTVQRGDHVLYLRVARDPLLLREPDSAPP